MNSLFRIEIPKRNGHCFHQGEQFTPQMEIISVLIENEKKFLRRDFCCACWTQMQGKIECAEVMIYWKSKMETAAMPARTSKINKALSLLKKMLETPEAQEDQLYVLCIFLAHARQLIFRQEFQKEGHTFQIYEMSPYEEFVTVKVQNLNETQISTIQQSLATQLNQDINTETHSKFGLSTAPKPRDSINTSHLILEI